ncbi:DUF3303 domain-containing protein [Longimicrobium sp.]|jgi:hypothetical protein|uniref:DUF3303 domain-containing protein n=1 Tax=Longimicrobium sp. TaxID=2029185 RepID=UPI002ED92D16
MLYMVLEDFRGDPAPVYRRFRDRGRLAPEGLRYVSSWVTPDLQRCFQVMECDRRELLDEWIDQWKDLVDFEVIPVLTSAEAAALMGPRL